jgi:hypothetical protein
MSRALFMAKLKEGLAGLPQPEIDEITSDYEFHFAEAAATGLSEDDTAAALGDPARLARELLEQRGAGEEKAVAEAPTPSRLRRLGLLLGLVLAAGAAAAIYYQVGRSPAPNAPATPAQAVMTAPPNGARIVISGGQALDLGTLAQDRIEIVVDGGGHASARGKVKELIVHVDGSGSADFGALQADNVRVELSGTGKAEVSAAQTADITISGSGNVSLKVKPKTLKQSVTGSGQVLLPS